MKQLSDYPTPETDANHGEGRFIHCVDDDFARMLEQRCGMLREALADVLSTFRDDGKTVVITEDRQEAWLEVIKMTEPKL